MGTFVNAGKTSDIPSGSMKTISVFGRKFALANVDGHFFAVDDTCTHEECSLGTEGFLDGSAILCGCHGAQFDLTNGKVLSLPATADLRSYQVKIEGDDVMVEV